jgi:hypothetical protein
MPATARRVAWRVARGERKTSRGDAEGLEAGEGVLDAHAERTRKLEGARGCTPARPWRGARRAGWALAGDLGRRARLLVAPVGAAPRRRHGPGSPRARAVRSPAAGGGTAAQAVAAAGGGRRNGGDAGPAALVVGGGEELGPDGVALPLAGMGAALLGSRPLDRLLGAVDDQRPGLPGAHRDAPPHPPRTSAAIRSIPGPCSAADGALVHAIGAAYGRVPGGGVGAPVLGSGPRVLRRPRRAAWGWDHRRSR